MAQRGTTKSEATAEPMRQDVPGLLAFVPAVSPQFTEPHHLREWCECIEACATGGVRALCSVPIRHFKTETTIHGIAFLLCKDPTIQIIYMVADERMANDRANRIRLVCEAAAARFGIDMGPEKGQNVKTSWKNSHGGGMQVMSAKQSRQGADVDVLMFDDPIDEDDVFDPKIRDRVDMAIAIYTARAGRPTRRGSVAGVMSRWHPDDPIGRRLTRKAEKWTSICNAALITTDSGEEIAFAPDIMPVEELRKRRSELAEIDPTERMWWANFQNNPLPDALGLFSIVHRYDLIPSDSPLRTVIGVDLSYTSNTHSDRIAVGVLQIWAQLLIENGREQLREVGYVVNFWCEAWNPTQAEALIRGARALYPGAMCFSYMSGPEIGIVHYLNDRGVPVQVIPARYSKRQRAQRTIDLCNAGRIRFPEHAPWAARVIARMRLFSGNERAGDDDEVDALVSAADGGMGLVGAPPRSLGRSRGGLIVR